MNLSIKKGNISITKMKDWRNNKKKKKRKKKNLPFSYTDLKHGNVVHKLNQKKKKISLNIHCHSFSSNIMITYIQYIHIYKVNELSFALHISSPIIEFDHDWQSYSRMKCNRAALKNLGREATRFVYSIPHIHLITILLLFIFKGHFIL